MHLYLDGTATDLMCQCRHQSSDRLHPDAFKEGVDVDPLIKDAAPTLVVRQVPPFCRVVDQPLNEMQRQAPRKL